jgi:hypothetical protein
MVEFNPQRFADANGYDAERLLRWLDLVQPSSRFPSAHRVKGHLLEYEDRKLLHSFKRGQLLLAALVQPGRLERIGLAPESDPNAAVQALQLSAVGRLPTGACLVRFGCGGVNKVHDEFVRNHVRSGGDLVQWLYELGPLVHPALFAPAVVRRFDSWLTDAVTWVPRWVCPSIWSAECLRLFTAERRLAPNIAALPLAAEFEGYGRHQTVVCADADIAQAARRPFVLCVGSLQPRKNGVVLVEIWKRLHAELKAGLPTLVFAGGLGSEGNDIRRVLADSGDLINRVLVVNAPTDNDLAFLYQRSLFTVYPSLSQGYGLPVGESVWFGRYCIASNADGIAESCGDLIDPVDASDPADLFSTLLHAITDPAYVKAHEKRIAAAKPRRWSEVAAEFAAFASGGVPPDFDDSTTDSGFELTVAPDQRDLDFDVGGTLH